MLLQNVVEDKLNSCNNGAVLCKMTIDASAVRIELVYVAVIYYNGEYKTTVFACCDWY
jgi:hypothetical protein